MARKRRSNKKRIRIMKEIAKSRAIELIQLAGRTYHEDPVLANRYVKHGREIAMGAKVRIPREYKRKICHGCKGILVPGLNVRIRIHHRKNFGTFISISCLDCGHITRYIIKGNVYHLGGKENDN